MLAYLCVISASSAPLRLNRLFTAEAQRTQRLRREYAAEMLVALLLMHELPCGTPNEYNH